MTALLTIEPAVIVLLDLYLPDIRGFELLGKFRKTPRVLHFKTSTTYGFCNEKNRSASAGRPVIQGFSPRFIVQTPS